jgi:hypothetical protein
MTYKLAVFKNITHATLALRRAEIQKARLELDARRFELLAEKQRNKSASSEPIGVGAHRLAQGPEHAKGQAKRGESAGGTSRQEASRSLGGPGKSRASSVPTSSSGERACASNSEPNDQSETAHSRGSVSRAASPAPPTPPQHCEPPESENHSHDGSNSIESGESLNTTKGAQPAGNPPTPAATAAVTSSKPAAPPDVPLWPNRRPGAPPRNASPRNPLGLL